MRRFAYARYSEGRAAHWLILLASDRVDAAESRVTALLAGHPDNPIAETGVKAEATNHGLVSRRGAKRADRGHLWLDPLIVAGPWILSAVLIARALKKLCGRG